MRTGRIGIRRINQTKIETTKITQVAKLKKKRNKKMKKPPIEKLLSQIPRDYGSVNVVANWLFTN